MNENNIYIGNRYVPILVGEWDKNRSYDSLSIVTYAGTSYTSTKNVPVGTEIDNTDFWVVTGNYNAQVEQYRKQTEALYDKVDLIVNRNIIVIGDSYGKGWDQAGNQYTPYTTFASQYTGVPIKNESESGAGFANTGDNGNTFAGLISKVANEMSKIDRDKVTDVLFVGGFNDRTHSASEITNGIVSCISIVKNSFENAKYGCGMIGWSTYSPDYPSLNAVLYRYQREFTPRGGYYITDIDKSMHNYTFFADDGIHPNQNGHIFIGLALADFITGYNNNIQTVGRSTVTVNPENNMVLSSPIKQTRTNGTCWYGWDENFNITKMQVFGEHTLNGSEQFKICTLAKAGFAKGYYGMMFSTPCTIVDTANKVHIGFATVKIINGEMFVLLVCQENNQFLTTTISYITLPPTYQSTPICEN
jgi:hypothetical protein